MRQVFRDLIDDCLKHFAPVSIYRSIELQTADPGVFPGFLDCGRVNAEFEYAHGFLNPCRQRTRVFSLKFSSKLCGKTSNLSLRVCATRLFFEQTKDLKALTLDRLQPLNGFIVFHNVVSSLLYRGYST